MLTVGSGKLTYDNLVRMYKQGKYDQVAKNLEPLANGGHVAAQELIGIMYRNGQGVPKDPKKAYDYLSQAANTGRGLAEYHLGTMYYAGEGVQADSIMALMWLQIAIVHFPEGPEGDAEKNPRRISRDSLYLPACRAGKKTARCKWPASGSPSAARPTCWISTDNKREIFQAAKNPRPVSGRGFLFLICKGVTTSCEPSSRLSPWCNPTSDRRRYNLSAALHSQPSR